MKQHKILLALIITLSVIANANAFFDPNKGRFLSRDPIEEQGGLNIYGFVGNDPAGNIDPFGLNLYAIDGTGNDQSAQANVLKFLNRYKDGTPTYNGGPGNPSDGVLGGMLFGRGSANISKTVFNRICNDYQIAVKHGTNITIDIIGFSRGSAIANEIAWQLKNKGCPCSSQSNQKSYPRVRFLGLFDPVHSYPNAIAWKYHSRSIAPNVANAAIAYAMDERRLLFRPSILSASDATSLAVETFPGRHSDVGGHVANNPVIGQITLKWMIDQATQHGVQMDTEGLPSQERINRWLISPAIAPGPEEAWSGILNDNWTINWGILITSPWLN